MQDKGLDLSLSVSETSEFSSYEFSSYEKFLLPSCLKWSCYEMVFVTPESESRSESESESKSIIYSISDRLILSSYVGSSPSNVVQFYATSALSSYFSNSNS